MAQWACSNPSCHSFGKPHPNCKCAPPMADGGQVGQFCDQDQPHGPGCEYGQPQVNPEVMSDAADNMLSGDPSEESKWMVGQEDKQKAVASALLHSGATHLLNGTMHGIYADPDSGLRALGNKDVKKKIEKHLIQPTQSNESFLKKVNSGNKLAAPMLMRMINNGQSQGFNNLLSYAQNISKGSKTIDSALDNLFGEGKFDHENPSKEDRDKLDEYIKNGKFQEQLNDTKTQGFAAGGVVSDKQKSLLAGTGPMENTLPDHNIMIQEAKGRVNNYLNSIRPTDQPSGLPFDEKPDNSKQKRSYHRALDLANKPIGILNQLKKGEITPEDMGHFTNLYPEVHDHLSKKMTEKIVKAQMGEGKKPDYKTRQGMSLFLGANLDSTFLPQNIMAAQAVFAGQQAPQKPPPAAKTSKLGDAAKSSQTPEQAAESREQRAK